MALETINGTLQLTRLMNESADYVARREELRLAEIELMRQRERVAAMRRRLLLPTPFFTQRANASESYRLHQINCCERRRTAPLHRAENVRINISVADRAFTGTLNNSKAAQENAATLELAQPR
jgi:hypothetical protein